MWKCLSRLLFICPVFLPNFQTRHWLASVYGTQLACVETRRHEFNDWGFETGNPYESLKKWRPPIIILIIAETPQKVCVCVCVGSCNLRLEEKVFSPTVLFHIANSHISAILRERLWNLFISEYEQIKMKRKKGFHTQMSIEFVFQSRMLSKMSRKLSFVEGERRRLTQFTCFSNLESKDGSFYCSSGMEVTKSGNSSPFTSSEIVSFPIFGETIFVIQKEEHFSFECHLFFVAPREQNWKLAIVFCQNRENFEFPSLVFMIICSGWILLKSYSMKSMMCRNGFEFEMKTVISQWISSQNGIAFWLLTDSRFLLWFVVQTHMKTLGTSIFPMRTSYELHFNTNEKSSKWVVFSLVFVLCVCGWVRQFAFCFFWFDIRRKRNSLINKSLLEHEIDTFLHHRSYWTSAALVQNRSLGSPFQSISQFDTGIFEFLLFLYNVASRCHVLYPCAREALKHTQIRWMIGDNHHIWNEPSLRLPSVCLIQTNKQTNKRWTIQLSLPKSCEFDSLLIW